MTEINERVTVDFDSESYYLDGEYWESWDNYGEEMADKINELLNEVAEENKGIQDKIFKLLDWLETEKGVSRKEIKEWWND